MYLSIRTTSHKSHATFWLEGHCCHGGHLLLFWLPVSPSIPGDAELPISPLPSAKGRSRTEQACQGQAARLQVCGSPFYLCSKTCYFQIPGGCWVLCERFLQPSFLSVLRYSRHVIVFTYILYSQGGQSLGVRHFARAPADRWWSSIQVCPRCLPVTTLSPPPSPNRLHCSSSIRFEPDLSSHPTIYECLDAAVFRESFVRISRQAHRMQHTVLCLPDRAGLFTVEPALPGVGLKAFSLQRIPGMVNLG